MKNHDLQNNNQTIRLYEKPRIYSASRSIIGTRDYQQDAYFIAETIQAKLAVICDGMGGMECGERASQKAVEKIVEDFENWDGLNAPAFLLYEAKQLDVIVAEMKDDFGKIINAGTTIVAVLIQDNLMYWLSVGDSRIYVLRGNEMQCVTRDHNYGYKMKKKLLNGEISREEFIEKQNKFEALVSYIGMGGLEMIDVNKTPFELMCNDRILLCSDGLYKCLNEKVLKQLLLARYESLNNTIDSLISAVERIEKKYKDNTTIIMMSYQ